LLTTNINIRRWTGSLTGIPISRRGLASQQALRLIVFLDAVESASVSIF
jgi:hypothetical protein